MCACVCDRAEEVPACPITVHCSCGTKSRQQRLLKVTLPGAHGYHDQGLCGYCEWGAFRVSLGRGF